MKKIWNAPSVSNYGNVSHITNSVTVTCPSSEKVFGAGDGFFVAGQAIKCAASF